MKKAIIKRSHNEKYGYKIVAEGYIPEYLEEDLEMLADDLASTNTLEISEKLRDFKKFYRRKNGLVIRFKQNFWHLPKCEFGIDREIGTERTIPSIRIGMKVRRSILWMLWETYSC